MSPARKSGVRAVSLRSRVDHLVEGLRAARGRLVAVLAEVDEALADAELLRGYVEELPGAIAPGADAAERAHLRVYGLHGRTVLSVAEASGVPLRQLLGPGAAVTSEASAARQTAVIQLLSGGLSPTDVGRVLRLTCDAVRMRVLRARKEAA